MAQLQFFLTIHNGSSKPNHTKKILCKYRNHLSTFTWMICFKKLALKPLPRWFLACQFRSSQFASISSPTNWNVKWQARQGWVSSVHFRSHFLILHRPIRPTEKEDCSGGFFPRPIFLILTTNDITGSKYMKGRQLRWQADLREDDVADITQPVYHPWRLATLIKETKSMGDIQNYTD